jgi:hypothetical protein
MSWIIKLTLKMPLHRHNWPSSKMTFYSENATMSIITKLHTKTYVCALYSRHILAPHSVFSISACRKHLVRELNLIWYFFGLFSSWWPRINDCLLISYQGSSESEHNISARRPEDHSQLFSS